MYSRCEGDEGTGAHTPCCFGVARCRVCAGVQESTGLPIHSAEPGRWAVCDGGDGRSGASWEPCVRTLCAHCHSHDWSRVEQNNPEHGRSSPLTGRCNLEGRILWRIYIFIPLVYFFV